MKRKSRYYDNAERGLPAEEAAAARALFEAACERFGDAYEGGCFCTLLRGHYRTEDGEGQPYRCKLHGNDQLRTSPFDHATFFQRKGELVNAVVGQPYDCNDNDLRILKAFCNTHGLEMDVGQGWHYPGYTKALIFMRGPKTRLMSKISHSE